jgi:formylglycine-generating enzyme required for sulfatase activity
MKLWVPLFFVILIFSGCTGVEEKQEIPRAEPTPKRIEKEGMVFIPATKFIRGNDKTPGNGEKYPEEGPAHEVEVHGFWIDKYEVTNAEFKKFIDETGYVTFAEKPLDKNLFPNAPDNQLEPGATIFSPPPDSINPWDENNPWDWWSYTAGASWKKPFGPNSSIYNLMDHPVVCINIDDAKAYAEWAGKRLPTEAEWELAARGGLKNNLYSWGNEPKPGGEWMANCFQGKFPSKNSAQDGYHYTSPVGSFPPNGFGLYDMAGNVWEMCSDYFHPSYYTTFLKNPHPNPKGPKSAITQIELDHFRSTGTCPTKRPGTDDLMFLHVAKGGSYLCHWDYCLRYRPAARNHSESLSPTNHTGFRCAKDLD